MNFDLDTGYLAGSIWHLCVNYRPQTKFAKVMFLHVSVILSTGVGSPGPYPGRRLGGLARGVSRPIPRGEVEGSGRGGLQAHTQGGGWGSGWRSLGPGGCVSQHALRQTLSPADGYCCGRYASYWNAFFLWIWVGAISTEDCFLWMSPSTKLASVKVWKIRHQNWNPRSKQWTKTIDSSCAKSCLLGLSTSLYSLKQ